MSGDCGRAVSSILQGVRQSKSVDESGEREDKTMKMITGLLVIIAGAIISNTLFAVPRYSASVPQVGDSSNAITAQQVDSKMNNERGGAEKEIMVDAVKGCRDGAAIGIVSGSLREDIASEAAGGLSGVASESGARQSWVQSSGAQAIQNAGSDHDPLISPKYGLIPAANIREYPHADTYLDLSDADVSHYFILKEDYVFQNLDGRSYSIPAGFIWDGASIAKWLGAVPGLLEVGNTRYNSALAEGLIHDYMYRNPQQFTKKESDDLFYENLKRNNNLNPRVMSAGVKIFGGRAYLGHAFNRISHEYWFDKLPDFYANNLRLYQRSIDTSKLEALLKEQIAFDLSLLQKGQQMGEKATTSEIANHNSRNDKIFQELVSICKKIDALKLSDDEKVQKLKDTLTPIMDKYATNSKSITQKLVDGKIVEGLQSPSFNPREIVDVGFLNSDAAKARKAGQP